MVWVGKRREQDAVALLVNLPRARHCAALTVAHLIALAPADKIPDSMHVPYIIS